MPRALKVVAVWALSLAGFLGGMAVLQPTGPDPSAVWIGHQVSFRQTLFPDGDWAGAVVTVHAAQPGLYRLTPSCDKCVLEGLEFRLAGEGNGVPIGQAIDAVLQEGENAVVLEARLQDTGRPQRQGAEQEFSLTIAQA
ncbi:MAG: hypothetical protein ACR2H3_05935 [Acidimicrobiales bacterium]